MPTDAPLGLKPLGSARRHLERALREIAGLVPSDDLPAAWVAALQRIGQSTAERL